MQNRRTAYRMRRLHFLVLIVKWASSSSSLLQDAMRRIRSNNNNYILASSTAEDGIIDYQTNHQVQLHRETKKDSSKKSYGSYGYGADGNSWEYQTEIQCSAGIQNVEKSSLSNVIVTYEYAVETTTNKNIESIRQKLEFDMLKVAANDLCGASNVHGIYSSLPVDKTAGTCTPSDDRALECTSFSGQMTASVKTDKEAAAIIYAVRSAMKYACDTNSFVKSSDSGDLIKVKYLSPDLSPSENTQEVKKSRSMIPYALMGALIGIILMLLMFLTVWYVKRQQRQRQQTKKTTASVATAEDDSDSEFQGPDYGNLGKHTSGQDVHRCMSMMCYQCLHQQEPAFLPTKLQQNKEHCSDMASI